MNESVRNTYQCSNVILRNIVRLPSQMLTLKLTLNSSNAICL